MNKLGGGNRTHRRMLPSRKFNCIINEKINRGFVAFKGALKFNYNDGMDADGTDRDDDGKKSCSVITVDLINSFYSIPKER